MLSTYTRRQQGRCLSLGPQSVCLMGTSAIKWIPVCSLLLGAIGSVGVTAGQVARGHHMGMVGHAGSTTNPPGGGTELFTAS